MSGELRIDFVAPPFAGHLYPALDLAVRLKERGFGQIRFLTTEGGRQPVESTGFPFVEILPGHDQDVWAIANTQTRVGSNPVRMWRQCQNNLALMHELQRQVRSIWSNEPPHLVIVDFVVPVAGLTAQTLGIPWWTGMATPCVLETRDGTPAYLGGWMPRPDRIGRIRDWLGRKTVRAFKRMSARLFAKPLASLGIPTLYRPDGTEVVYSPERILAYGMRELEFERTWPDHVHFVGPLTTAPVLTRPQLRWHDGKKHVLVTLGTHLLWAKSQAIQLIQNVAVTMPDVIFHFSRGRMGMADVQQFGNLHVYDSIPYDTELNRYDAAIIHGGTGIMYACIENRVPMLVWPHDYDQFDHAARIVHHQLGLRLKPTVARIQKDLRTLFADAQIRSSLEQFGDLASKYDAGEFVRVALRP